MINVSSGTEDPHYLCQHSESMIVLRICSQTHIDRCHHYHRFTEIQQDHPLHKDDDPFKESYFLVAESSLCRLAPFRDKQEVLGCYVDMVRSPTIQKKNARHWLCASLTCSPISRY